MNAPIGVDNQVVSDERRMTAIAGTVVGTMWRWTV